MCNFLIKFHLWLLQRSKPSSLWFPGFVERTTPSFFLHHSPMFAQAPPTTLQYFSGSPHTHLPGKSRKNSEILAIAYRNSRTNDNFTNPSSPKRGSDWATNGSSFAPKFSQQAVEVTSAGKQAQDDARATKLVTGYWGRYHFDLHPCYSFSQFWLQYSSTKLANEMTR